MAIMAASTEHAITLHRPSWIGHVGIQIAATPSWYRRRKPVMMGRYRLPVDNIRRRTRYLLLETRRQL